MTGRRAPADGHRLEWAGMTIPLRPGTPVTFGRGTDREIRLPNDPLVSRAAGSVTAYEHHLLLENVSRTRPFLPLFRCPCSRSCCWARTALAS